MAAPGDDFGEADYETYGHRLLRARRIMRFVSMTIALAVTTLFCTAAGIWSKYFSNGEMLQEASRVFFLFSLLTFVGLVGSFIPLQLELGSSTRRWGAAYRAARRAVDADRAYRVEQQTVEPANQAEDDDAPNPDRVAQSVLNLTMAKSEADLRETSRWEIANYPALTRAIIERLQAEIATQGGRANVNLGIALAVASVGVVILGWLSLNVSEMLLHPPAKSDYGTLLYTGAFLAKLTLALSANVFAFFFLATYRRNLSEIRYFHNELTNVQTRILALYLAADRQMDASLALAIKGLSSTERNFILKKGESTADLSLKGLDATEISTLTSLLKEMVQVAKKTE